MWCSTILIECPAVIFVLQNGYSSALILFELAGIPFSSWFSENEEEPDN